MFRNREVKLQAVILTLLTVLGAGLTYAALLLLVAVPRHVALIAALGTGALGMALSLVCLAFTAQRYRALARMAEKLNAALSGDRNVNFHDMNEGELAILASELDKTVARLNLAVEELQAEKLALSDSLANISHQLKTPLTSIALTTELVAGRLAEEPDMADALERIRLVQRLQMHVDDLVSALLKLARIDAGVIKLTRVPVSAHALVASATEPLTIAFDIADVTLQTDIQADAAFEGDHAWSAEALENILKNCLEHTPAGGTVHIAATQDALACRLRITDTGPGIAEEDLPHIFERFYRGQSEAENTGAYGAAQRAVSSIEVNPAGVGIGLSLAQSLITAQGGKLTATNARDARGHITGAQFDITFFKTVV